MPKSPEHLEAALGLLLAAWLCWRVIRGLARVVIVCALGLLLTGILGCGVPGEAGSTAGSRFDGGRSGTLTRVVDGDTVHVQIAGDDVTLRILGSAPPRDEEAPRLRRRGGDGPDDASRAAGHEGHRHHRQHDRGHGRRVRRTLGFADVRGRDVGEQIIRAGRATVYSYRGRRFSRLARYEAAERDARAARRGSWAACPGFDSRR